MYCFPPNINFSVANLDVRITEQCYTYKKEKITHPQTNLKMVVLVLICILVM